MAKAGNLFKVKATLKTRDKARKRIKNLLDSMANARSFVKVGFVQGSKANRENSGGLTNVDVATFNELGTSTIPPRPFLGPSIRNNHARYMEILRRFVKEQVQTGKRSYPSVLNLLGAKAAADVKNFVTQGDPIPPPNAPSTLKRKQKLGRGSPVEGPTREGEAPLTDVRTLVDTGRMINSITWKVVKR